MFWRSCCSKDYYLHCKDEGKYPWTRSRYFEKSFGTTLRQLGDNFGTTWDNFDTTLRQLWEHLLGLQRLGRWGKVSLDEVKKHSHRPGGGVDRGLKKKKSGEQSKKHYTILTTHHHYKWLSTTIFVVRQEGWKCFILCSYLYHVSDQNRRSKLTCANLGTFRFQKMIRNQACPNQSSDQNWLKLTCASLGTFKFQKTIRLPGSG